MILIHEYLAMRVLGGSWPEGLPDDDDQALTASRHRRLLQRIHAFGTGQLSQRLAALSAADLAVFRHAHPEILHVLDPRPLLDDAARLAAAYGERRPSGTDAWEVGRQRRRRGEWQPRDADFGT